MCHGEPVEPCSSDAEGTHDEGRSLALNAIGVDDWRLWRELRIEALREAPYAFGSKLSDWQGPGDTEERWKARLAGVPLNIVARLDGMPAGMVSADNADDGNTVDLISMWVAPFARGRGVGHALIEAVALWSKRQRATRVRLAVRDRNKHAIALYSRHGFVDKGPAPNLTDNEPKERLMIRQLLDD